VVHPQVVQNQVDLAPGAAHLSLDEVDQNASAHALARLGHRHPVAQRPLDRAQRLGGHHDAHRLDVLDGLFRELGHVLCFQILFISRPSGLDANHRPLDDEERRAAHRRPHALVMLD
jgi:hypothetical protein